MLHHEIPTVTIILLHALNVSQKPYYNSVILSADFIHTFLSDNSCNKLECKNTRYNMNTSFKDKILLNEQKNSSDSSF
jgi:hypothetical protein